MSLRLRFIFAILGAITLSLVASTSISTYLSTEEMRSVLLKQSRDKLTAKKSWFEPKWRTISPISKGKSPPWPTTSQPEKPRLTLRKLS